MLCLWFVTQTPVAWHCACLSQARVQQAPDEREQPAEGPSWLRLGSPVAWWGPPDTCNSSQRAYLYGWSQDLSESRSKDVDAFRPDATPLVSALGENGEAFKNKSHFPQWSCLKKKQKNYQLYLVLRMREFCDDRVWLMMLSPFFRCGGWVSGDVCDWTPVNSCAVVGLAFEPRICLIPKFHPGILPFLEFSVFILFVKSLLLIIWSTACLVIIYFKIKKKKKELPGKYLWGRGQGIIFPLPEWAFWILKRVRLRGDSSVD